MSPLEFNKDTFQPLSSLVSFIIVNIRVFTAGSSGKKLQKTQTNWKMHVEAGNELPVFETAAAAASLLHCPQLSLSASPTCAHHSATALVPEATTASLHLFILYFLFCTFIPGNCLHPSILLLYLFYCSKQFFLP